jgi:hypothetical protein
MLCEATSEEAWKAASEAAAGTLRMKVSCYTVDYKVFVPEAKQAPRAFTSVVVVVNKGMLIRAMTEGPRVVPE